MTPKEKWDQLKARGNPTVAEIDAIDAETPWREVEPAWWIEMMGVRANIGRGTQPADV